MPRHDDEQDPIDHESSHDKTPTVSPGHDHDSHDHEDHAHEDHAHDNSDTDHEDDHDHGHGFIGRLKGIFVGHSHDAAVAVDGPLETSSRGLRALWISFGGLIVTALIQGVVVVLSGLVALLGDTLHNLSDAFTAIPLAIAFTVGRRAPNRRFTYGYGRAEDLAGIVIVVFIAFSAVLAGYEAIQRLIHPQDVRQLLLVASAALVGFIGNELVARYRIKVGREIGSAALVADGMHAHTDALTSLAVLFGAIGVGLGFRLADPIVGLMISVAIILVLRDAAREVYRRLMDAVDPELVERVKAELRGTPGVLDLGDVRVRWIGHTLRAECEVIVEHDLSLVQAHGVAEEAQHRLLHGIPRLTAALVHADPFEHEDANHHELTGHHAPGPARAL